MGKPLATCQCKLTAAHACSATATAEDLLCDACRTATQHTVTEKSVLSSSSEDGPHFHAQITNFEWSFSH